jgi:5-methyltetrahydrofolate--homocysteine methyltransferase
MNLTDFIAVGENIHCTRIYKVGGKFVRQSTGGAWEIAYNAADGPRTLPVPEPFTQNADWEAGKVKHCAVAIWQGTQGDDTAAQKGIAYLQTSARKQEAAGAHYLDVNVDEYSTDVAERASLMQWTVDVVQQAVGIPVSIDSSNSTIIRAGLEQCDQSRGRPMVNSVSLERTDLIELAREHNAVVIASAAGAQGLPSTLDERLDNLAQVMARLTSAGFAPADIHVDPLVFPISVDGQNGRSFLETVATVRKNHGSDIHIIGGLSNVSFGMPNRKLINQVFAYLTVEHGGDGGIVDPLQINTGILNGLDPESEPFQLARALLLGEDEFGMDYISASRDGRI